MIGHELTVAHGIDHARTLAIVLPSLLNVQREHKRSKLLQYAARVWGLDGGDEDGRIEAAIARTEYFFRHMGVKTRLADYGLNHASVDAVVAALEAHGMTALGELIQRRISHQHLDFEAVRPFEQPGIGAVVVAEADACRHQLRG